MHGVVPFFQYVLTTYRWKPCSAPVSLLWRTVGTWREDAAAAAALGREMLRHSVAVWCRFSTKPPSGQRRAGHRQSRVNLTTVQCLIITFISLGHHLLV